jgi:hypothetical protein
MRCAFHPELVLRFSKLRVAMLENRTGHGENLTLRGQSYYAREAYFLNSFPM